jgi:glycosyltransferase involved in cell wall biosynthesis
MSFVDAPPSAEAVERLSGCERLIAVPAPERNMATRLGRMVSDGRPDMAHRLQSPQFEMTLTRLLLQGGGAPEKAVEPFDVVQVEGIELSFAIDIVRRHEPAPKIIFDDHNAEYELQRRAYLADRFTPSRLPATLYSMVQARRLRAYERRICNSADHVVAVSENDGRLLSELGIETPVSIIPNSIDVRDYAPDGTLPLRYDLVFVGKMDYRPNVDAVLWFWSEVWPALKRQRPAITWAIVGKNPHTRLDALSRRQSPAVSSQ